ncbi:hypothetical protein NPIL_162951 [Nephila pilipes]|uniref:Uncharacterized protein n=1 Tax=Nephila pilipes TaxID=299642 RepID=A0A8X6MF73_NEPPI|nr:hypothetical protein NPIL_162951 [Nephila pilipes]
MGPLVGPGPAQPLAVCSSLHAMTHHRLDNNAVGMHGPTITAGSDHKKRAPASNRRPGNIEISASQFNSGLANPASGVLARRPQAVHYIPNPLFGLYQKIPVMENGRAPVALWDGAFYCQNPSSNVDVDEIVWCFCIMHRSRRRNISITVRQSMPIVGLKRTR